MDLKAIRAALRAARVDGWLLCDFRNRDFLAYRVVGLHPQKLNTRRWYYFIPAKGQPWKLVSAVERHVLDALPGSRTLYTSWEELHAGIGSLLGAKKTIAMQYCRATTCPHLAVDAGTIELITGPATPSSSADLVQMFVSVIDEEGYRLHKEAARLIDRIRARPSRRSARPSGRNTAPPSTTSSSSSCGGSRKRT
jgi:hypothetical protein